MTAETKEKYLAWHLFECGEKMSGVNAQNPNRGSRSSSPRGWVMIESKNTEAKCEAQLTQVRVSHSREWPVAKVWRSVRTEFINTDSGAH